jgi:serine/threonine protein phosphatase PrpC
MRRNANAGGVKTADANLVHVAGGLKASQQMITAMPEIREEQLQEDDEFLILACDGIWENLSSQQVRRRRLAAWRLTILAAVV